MTDRFLTHISTVSLFHLALLVTGALFFEQEATKALGLRVVNLQIAGGVHLGGSSAKEKAREEVKKVTTPKKKVIAGNTMGRAQESEKTVATETATESAEDGGRPGANPGVGGGGSVFGNALADIRTIYKAELEALIDRNTFYPMTARRLGQTGTVQVAFTLLADGSITNVKISDSSGNSRLDTAGLEAVKKVKKFKALPSEFKTSSLDMNVPIRFKLQ